MRSMLSRRKKKHKMTMQRQRSGPGAEPKLSERKEDVSKKKEVTLHQKGAK